MGIVLYRKFRPKKFSEVIGQRHIIKTLTNAISKGLISHAYLFYGPRGCGKTTVARLLAKAINCEKRKENEFEPCNECPICQEINEGRCLDLIEIDAASHRGIDEIRELKEGVKFSPTKAKYKVFILDEAHQLSKDAANALLKTLEEPPPHAIFILATTEIHKMIPTILSRCQRFDFRKLTLSEILKKLEYICQKEGIKIERKALELIGAYSGGALRDAESLMDQIAVFSQTLSREVRVEDIKELLGLVEVPLIIKFVEFLGKEETISAINFLTEISEKGIELQEFNKSLINYLRQMLILKIVKKRKSLISDSVFKGLTREEIGKLSKQSQQFSLEKIQKMINLFIEAQNKMRYSPILQLPLEMAVVKICENSPN